jgi:hypothetical protein
VSAPRLAAIEYPLGRTLGQPGAAAGQMAVLRAVLQALREMDTPGSIRHLPSEWPEPPNQVRNHPPQAPPISAYLKRNPCFLPNWLTIWRG